MAGLSRSLRPVAEAIIAAGLPALRGEADLADLLPAIADLAIRDRAADTLLYDSAAASPSDLAEAARSVADAVAAGHAPAVRDALASWLSLVPGSVLRSAGGPASVSVATRIVRGEAEPAPRTAPGAALAAILPPRVPRFRPGDRPAGLGGDWSLDLLLGVGGFGEVWRARHLRFASIPPVAVKFCLNAAARDRLLLHEASVLDRVLSIGHHPGIVPLRDARLDAEPPCLVYEYVAGGDLARLVDSWPPAPDSRRLALADRAVRDLSATVGHMHRLDPPIVHRDLKPSNVLVQRPTGSGSFAPGDPGYTLRVTDFGIGAAGGSGTCDLSKSGLLGSHTPPFASPQQRRGEPATPRDDVHALGVIWYQLLTGDRRAGKTGRLPDDWPARLEAADVPAPMVRLLARCVAEDPADRPADAADLAEALAGLSRPASVHGEAVVPGYRSGALIDEADAVRACRARRESDGREVRLVVFGDDTAPEDVLRVLRVVQPALERAGVSGVPRALDAGGLPDGRAWLVSELPVGLSLRARLAGGALPTGQACRLGRELARLIQAIHAAGRPRDGAPGFIHGRISPGVIFPEAGGVRLADVGLSGAGDPAYAAPESLDGGRPTPRTDVFGLGAVLAHMLTGQPPFAEGRETPYRAGSGPRGPLPRPLADLLARCLHPDPARRPTPDDVARTLRPFADNPTPAP